MNNQDDGFFERCLGIVAELKVENEAQAIAKEVVLSEVEKLQNNWNELKKIVEEKVKTYPRQLNAPYVVILEKMQEIEGVVDND